MMGCFLSGFPHDCGGPRLHGHHILGRAVGCAKAQDYIRDNAHFFIQPVCANSNVGRIADTHKARAFMFRKLENLRGREYVDDMLRDLRACYKADRPEFTLEAIYAAGKEG
jgi:hypothetical protein